VAVTLTPIFPLLALADAAERDRIANLIGIGAIPPLDLLQQLRLRVEKLDECYATMSEAEAGWWRKELGLTADDPV
jgi:hypothetical protein